MFHPSEQAWQLLSAERARGGSEYETLLRNLREIEAAPDAGTPTMVAGAQPGDLAHRCGRWRLIYSKTDDGIHLRQIVRLIAF